MKWYIVMEEGWVQMFYSLRNRLILTFALLLIASFIAMYLFISNQVREIIGDSLESSVSETMDQYAFSVNTVITQIEDFANLMFNSDMTQAWLSTQADSDMSKDHKMLADLKMRQFLTRTTANYSVISSVSVFHRNGLSIGIQDQIFRDQNFAMMDWYVDFKNENKQWVSVHKDPYQPSSMTETPVISLVFPLGVYNPAQAEGVLKVNFHSSLIQDPLDQISLGEQGQVILVDWEGKSILTQEDPVLIKNIKIHLDAIRDSNATSGMLRLQSNDKPHFMLYRTLKVKDWILISMVSEADIYKNLTNLNSTMVIIIAILLVITVMAASLLSTGIVKPLSRLSGAMHYLQNGDFSRAERYVSRYMNPKTEVGYVTNSFLIMIQQLKQHIKSEFEMNLRRQGAEYKALLMQINPHFLYNTLEVISSLTVQKRTSEAIDVIESLGKMLRFSLNIQTDLVSIQEELQYIKHYVLITKVRFSDRLVFDINIDPAIERNQIVKFILQPIVENAIKYSLAHEQVAEVSIKGWIENDKVHFQVQDNGVGLPAYMADQMIRESKNTQFTEVLNTTGNQIGLRNVLARCALYYGDSFAVNIQSKLGSGTSITISIPKRGTESNESV